MQYTTLLALAAASVHALPSLKHDHHFQHAKRDAEAAPGYDTSNVDWKQALKNVDWSKVNFNLVQGSSSVTNVDKTVTVAVVGTAPATTLSSAVKPANNAAPATTPATTPAATTPATTPAAAATTSTTTPAAAGATTPASNGLWMTPSASEYAITVVNNCPYTIWQAGWQTNKAGALIADAVKGNTMLAGSKINLAIPKKAFGVQIWGRTGCTGSGSSFHCSVGDCQGYQCSSIIWQDGPVLAEFGSGLDNSIYNTDITAYDISAIPGNNLGVKIEPSITSCQTKYCPISGCSNDQAWHLASDMDLGSPADTICSNAANFVVTFCPA
ncbi:Thaumatin [Savitreella phatthalungensis]